MENFDPLAAKMGSGVRSTPPNSNGFHLLASLLQRRHLLQANYTLHDIWPSPGLVHLSMHLRRLLPPDGISPRAKFTLRPSVAFSHIGSVNTGRSSSGVSQTLRHGTRNGIRELSQRAPPIFAWAAITFGIGPHSSFLPRLISAVADWM